MKDNRIQELYSLWCEQKEDVLRTYTNKMPDRISLEQQKEFKTIRKAVVQAAMQLHIPQEEIPLSNPVPPRVDFVDDGSDVYPNAVRSLREPEVEPSPEVKQFLHEAAIRGSVDAVYGIGKQYLKTDIPKTISMFELAAEQGNTYAEYQLGKLYCFGQGVPQNLGVGMEWLKASARNGNEYAAQLLEKVEERLRQQTVSAVFGLFRGLAGMIQSSANQHIRDAILSTVSNGRKSRKRNRLSVSDPAVMNMTTTRNRPCDQYRRTAPSSVVRRHLTKRNKQIKLLNRLAKSSYGFFVLCESKTFLRVKNTTICCGFIKTGTAAYGGCFLSFGFVAVFSAGNEVGIDENSAVGYKGRFH